MYEFFATASKGLEEVLAEELRLAGVAEASPASGGVRFSGPLELGYRACLWSRVADRVLLQLARFGLQTADDLYEGVRSVRWDEHLGPAMTLAVDSACARSPLFSSSHFAALRVKDAVVDRLRDRTGARPTVDTARPDLRIFAYLDRTHAEISIDLGGGGLHRRGYRGKRIGPAPLKETLAAALLLLAEWPAAARRGAPLCDPMCGSGTLLTEAALIAADTAPGLLRRRWGFSAWRQHDADCWQRLRAEAAERDRRSAGSDRPEVIGADIDARAVQLARDNVERAGLSGWVRLERCAVDHWQKLRPAGRGLVVVNPPYGRRLGEAAALGGLYRQLGATLRGVFGGWTAFVLSGDRALGRGLGLRAARKYPVFNGPLSCRWLRYEIAERSADERGASDRPSVLRLTRSDDAEMFANRLRKNLRRLRPWFEREGISCYRIYDADIPEYAAAIDRYEDHLHVQHYDPPASVDSDSAERRMHDIVLLAADLLGVAHHKVHVKLRHRQRRGARYERLEGKGVRFIAREGGHRFWVNFDEHVDCGLFLDHRRTRALLAELSRDRRLLNLFCYTATASVYAARGGARATTSVDLSARYLSWAEDNFRLNGVSGPRNRLVRADCLDWLESARERYDVIFVDPPTFSNSKRMRRDLDLQRDHVELLRRAARLLDDDGVIVFSTNRRRFKLDASALAPLSVEEITERTTSRDFARTPPAHRCWLVRR